MGDISLDPHSKKINLMVNGPLSSVKITRHQPTGGKHLQSSNQVSPLSSRAVAAGQIDWWIERNHQDFLLEKDLKLLSVTDNCETTNVEEQAAKVSMQLSKDLASKKDRLENSREKLKQRLKQSALKKAEAFQKVLTQYHKDSIDNHAPYLNSKSQTPRARQRQESERIAAIIPKALSLDDLDITQLPATRPYMVLGHEKYSLHQQYFDFDATQRESSQSLQNRDKKELEKELRTSYRVGHLDEIKRKQFGKVYNETRQYYMDLERFKFLKEQTLRNENAQKLKKKKTAVTPNPVRIKIL